MSMGLRRESTFILFGEGIGNYSWRGARWFIITYFGAFWMAGLLAPVIYLWIQGIETPTDPDSLIAYLQSKPVAKYVDRVRLLFAAGALIWMIGACGLWGRFGYYWGAKGLTTLLKFMLLGMVSLGLVVAVQSVVFQPQPRESYGTGQVVEVILGAMLGGFVIGWLEEAIFRGMVLRMFYSATKPVTAIILSALVFAAVHFKSVPDGIGEPYHWYSGMLVAGYQSISVLLTIDALDFCNLFLAGVVLNLVFLRTGSLVGCMGLHAGWVLVRNTWSKLVEVPQSDLTQIWGTQRIVDGYASLVILIVLTIGLYVELIQYQKKGKIVLGQVP